MYGDRTHNDQYAASIATDYTDFIKCLKDLAISYIKDDDRNAFLMKYDSVKAEIAKNTSYTIGERRNYGSLISGRFELAKVQRIELEHDPKTSTSFKLGDITPQTIENLIKEGRRSAEQIFR